jgi:hypothetical protein
MGHVERRSPSPRRRANGTPGLALAIVRSVLQTRSAEFNMAVLTQRINDVDSTTVFSDYPAQKQGSARRMVEASVIQDMLAAEDTNPKR